MIQLKKEINEYQGIKAIINLLVMVLLVFSFITYLAHRSDAADDASQCAAYYMILET